MNARPPNLSREPWLAKGPARAIFAALTAEGAEARVIGGAVRNALLGVPVADIDFATTATPDDVARLAEAAHIKVVPTGVEHGTLTLVYHGQPFEVTTLREDIATDGRHAVVRFGRDWVADARRRDFTVNALSVDADGIIHDPIGGYEDVIARRIRFIGSPARRIAEDRLRILRFFRFNAEYGRAPVDEAGLAAATDARNALRSLSAERIGQEMRRLLVAPRAVEMAGLMQDVGVLPIVLAGIGYIATFERLVAFELAVGTEPQATLRLAALACRIEEDVARVAARLRLSNAERDRMLQALAAARDLLPVSHVRDARVALYRHGPVAYRDGVALAAVWSAGAPDAARWRKLWALPDEWTAPTFPLSGRDVIGQGTAPSPAVGEALRAVEAWWIEHDFAPDEAALRRHLDKVLARPR
jgi:tRNA nucleotidyltransferase/poly(A) polymerase